MTVGENIIRLSSLHGLTFEMYQTLVLPRILEIIVICKDTMA
jgi:vacuolar protein sorting-associated protein 35